MNIEGVYFSSNNLPENNAFKERKFYKKKEKENLNLKWVEAQYRAYSLSLTELKRKLAVEQNPKQIEIYKKLILESQNELTTYKNLIK